jgi:hypothetical protein
MLLLRFEPPDQRVQLCRAFPGQEQFLGIGLERDGRLG